jgi:uncharacterized protein (TIGR03435 family)
MVAISAIDAQSTSLHSGATISVEPSGSRFEVASIKSAPPVGSTGGQRGLRMDKAQASFGGMSLSALISYAYGVKLQQVTGPDWLTTERFDIEAKLPEGASMERVPEMMQRLLAERFGLKFHRESKEFPVYALVAAKAGIKLTPRPEDFDPRAHNDQIAIPILSITLLLEQIVDLPVVDETGLKGQYLFPSQAIRQAMTAGTTPNAPSRAAAASGGMVEAFGAGGLGCCRAAAAAGNEAGKEEGEPASVGRGKHEAIADGKLVRFRARWEQLLRRPSME